MIVAEVDAGSALIASTIVTAIASVVGASIALRANRNARSAKENTQPNGGSSSHDMLIGRIDGWGMTQERRTAEVERQVLMVQAGLAKAGVERAVIDQKLDDHLISSAEFGGAIADEGAKVLDRLAELERKANNAE